jgi:hypothetical protein
MLYSQNYALSALWEAAAAVGAAPGGSSSLPSSPLSGNLTSAAISLAGYLASIQLVSETHPELQGSWMRGFDYSLWEMWGAAGDHGWGPWSVESGWTTTWIAAGLGVMGLAETTDLWTVSMGGGGQGGITPQMFAAECPLFFNSTFCAEWNW